jgi:hypothetical protein
MQVQHESYLLESLSENDEEWNCVGPYRTLEEALEGLTAAMRRRTDLRWRLTKTEASLLFVGPVPENWSDPS